jgi:hypothetical protein
MNLQVIFVPAAIALLFLIFFGLSWWTSHSKSYRAWEMKQAQREAAELESRPKPPWADDPIAKSIEWTGTSAFGSDPNPNPKGATVRIRSVSANRIEFGPTSAWAWHAWMLFFGAAGYLLAFISTGSFTTALLAPLLCGISSGMVWLARRSTGESLTFDKQLGLYWRGKGPSAPNAGETSSEPLGRISDIYALQLIGTRRFVGNPRMGADSRHREYLTYELNLVLKDGKRLSTVCIDDYDGLNHDANILAAFLRRPLWKPR